MIERGTLLECGLANKRCPFNWDFLQEGGWFEGFVRENCPFERYDAREKNAICRWARTLGTKFQQ